MGRPPGREEKTAVKVASLFFSPFIRFSPFFFLIYNARHSQTDVNRSVRRFAFQKPFVPAARDRSRVGKCAASNGTRTEFPGVVGGETQDWYMGVYGNLPHQRYYVGCVRASDFDGSERVNWPGFYAFGDVITRAT